MGGVNMSDLFVDSELLLLEEWKKSDLFNKIREKNKGHERFKFLDGPVTANNRLGIHHAWGRTVKDTVLRYKTMRGYECKYQYGFDSQGLWVEVEVEKQLGFKTKKDIEAYGLDKFTHACVDRVKKFSEIITDQSIRLGMLMDTDHPYFTNTDTNIGGIWHFLKTCHENGWIEQEYKPMPWCPRCGTSLSEHEMTGSYKMLTHTSVYFKLPIEGKDAKLLVWTTTPWTLSANAAFAVNPEIDYAEVRVKSDDKPIILARGCIKKLGDDKLEVLRVFKGAELVGLTVETCFPELEKQQNVVHRIVAWEDVGADEGTGVVHIAPGCGIEDFELGLREGIPQIMPVDDAGIFLPGFGFYTGKDSHAVASEVFDELEKRGKLYKTEPIEHSYPVCWRCGSEVLFRLVPAWYIRTSELKPRLIKAANSVKWEPASSGKRMVDWLTNMGDWNISRKRYYGMPLPFYKCECGELTVIGSKAELKQRAVDPDKVDALPELHRPWIDEIKIRCPGCGASVPRVSEIGDVWMDAGIVPFSTNGFFGDKDEWVKNYPADWIIEMHEQIRLWFYSILFMSVVLEDRAPFLSAYSHSAVVAEDGSKFHKTGYMIKLDEAQEKMGSDAIRYLYDGAPLTNDVRFGYNLGDEARRKLLNFRNIYTFYKTYSDIDKPDLTGYVPDMSRLSLTDKYMLVRTNDFIKKATESMDEFKTYILVRDFEAFVDDISNWYIRTNRRRFWKSDDTEDKKLAYWVLYKALSAAVGCMAPVIPFLTDHIWRDLLIKLDRDLPESVHLSDWPTPIPGVSDDGITEATALAREVITVAMKVRNEKQIRVRQPLSKLYINTPEDVYSGISLFKDIILDELNVHEMIFTASVDELEDKYLSVNFKTAGAVLKGDVNRMKQTLADLPSELMSSICEKVANGFSVEVPGFDGSFAPELFIVQSRTKTGIAASEFGENFVLALDTNIDDGLRAEGTVRDIVRSFQVLRKDAGYPVEQRIKAFANTDSGFIADALNADRARISDELLADEFVVNAVFDADKTIDLALDDGQVTIGVKAVI